MGAFAEAVEIFTAQGIGVIPTRRETPAMPMVKHPDRFGVPASRKMSEKPGFGDANAGIWTGARSRLTIVDVDSTDPAHASDAIRTFGDTPLKVSTPSGGLHLYYRHAGERRSIRPFGKELPLDVLGNGLAVVPPSSRPAVGKKASGLYRVLEGDLRALDRLPEISPGAMPQWRKAGAVPPDAAKNDLGGLRDGDGRDIRLFDIARSLAMSCATEAELVTALLCENAEMAEPMPAAVVQAKAASAWRYKTQGRLMVAGTRAALMDLEVIERCSGNPAAFLMLAFLRSHHPPGHVFAIVPEAICVPLKMGHNTARRARDFLLADALLDLVAIGGTTRAGRKPNLYRLKPSPQNGRE